MNGETTSFRFDFGATARAERDGDGEIHRKCETASSRQCARATALDASTLRYVDDATWVGTYETYGDIEIVRCAPGCAASALDGCDADADVVPGVYEGGLKTWECAVDLATAIARGEIDIGSLKSLGDVHVLELGAGQAVPALVATRALGGACGRLTLTDYNRDVVEEVTAPNAQATMELMKEHGERPPREMVFLCGDWSGYDAYVDAGSVDVLLTSESIYDVGQYGSLCAFIAHALSDDGACYVAAKSYYFGVGGGTNAFVSYCEKNYDFKVERLKKFSDGKSNVREILVVRKTHD
ncbi:Nicotinamide N-methyltransferase-like [Ostreococcus tauri]|uniref:protein-histidine N-methyltransferase n=1 Tax=Ostreococcus tauri TaxID=70448 RepID=Q00WC7_OSTTA|nr:Nicotinamide N-methyltransferase-like [Ostreococcus tauri]OUS45851.1 hypothetical protein BE221DRAFT_205982 [Ostreococcus tauri]CAL56831.1 Nicotinamide N-methyltransferase-like [Ostreococcus tauri]|eukprot:XP_003082876.1 Nicotinamide N-methyltransferase-like [Ostreococcus tauri]